MQINASSKEKLDQVITEQVITNFSPLANVHRNLKRELVQRLFNMRDQEITLPGGKKQYKYNREKRMSLDREARILWRLIIIEAEKL